MKRFKKILLKLVLAGVLLALDLTGYAQCAMCRASVENNASNGDTALASSLNSGILYLFFTPYLLVGIVGFLWYYNSRRNGSK
ncbi:MAG: hypothetical protein MI921_15550 [Cytophagales bacterium]|nr:hypothetical protein [Cytophagales bacterium]